MADPTPPGDGLGPILDQLKAIKSRIQKLEGFSGTDYVRAVEKINDLIAGLPAQIADLAAAYLAAHTYTTTQVDTLVASPGTIAPTDVNATGHVTAAGAITATGDVSGANVTSSGTGRFDTQLQSVGARNNVVTSGYAGAWFDVNGIAGISPSSRRFKKNITTWVTDISKFMQLRPVMFRYKTQTTDDPKQIGLIAEEVVEAGFPEFTFNDDQGEIQGLNYDRMVVAVIAFAQAEHEARVAADARADALEARIAALEAK